MSEFLDFKVAVLPAAFNHSESRTTLESLVIHNHWLSRFCTVKLPNISIAPAHNFFVFTFSTPRFLVVVYFRQFTDFLQFSEISPTLSCSQVSQECHRLV